MDIKLIPRTELLKDRKESVDDVKICEQALKADIRSYSGGFVQERLDTNKRIIITINVELKRRRDKSIVEGELWEI